MRACRVSAHPCTSTDGEPALAGPSLDVASTGDGEAPVHQQQLVVHASIDPPGTEVPLVRLDPAWIAAVQPAEAPAQDSLCLALGNCQYVPGLVDRRPAQASYRRLAQRLEDAAAPRPQLLLLIGDQVYVDDTAGLFDADGSDDPAGSYLLSFRMPALRSVTSALPSYPLLDDHEVADNWQPEAPPTPAQSAALGAYIAFQHMTAADGSSESQDGLCSKQSVALRRPTVDEFGCAAKSTPASPYPISLRGPAQSSVHRLHPVMDKCS